MALPLLPLLLALAATPIPQTGPPSLSVANLTEGLSAVISIDNCAPGDSIQVAASLHGGGPIPSSFGFVNLTLPLILFSPMAANASGAAAFQESIPARTAGIPVWFHAVNTTTGQLSNSLAEVIGSYRAPRINSALPDEASQGSVAAITLRGGDFQNGAQIELFNNNMTISAEGEWFGHNSVIGGSLDLTLAPAGLYSLRVTNPNELSGELIDGFRVLPVAPSIASISPDAGDQGTWITATISGSGFIPGATAELRQGAEVIAGDVVIAPSGAALTASFLLRPPLGFYDTVITNPSGLSASLAQSFEVTEANLSFQGTVSDPSGALILAATVYLIPALDVANLPALTSANRRSTFDGLGGYDMPESMDFDEPLEDLVRLNGASFLSALTDADGRFAISDVPDGRFYVYVEPSDADHLPGGSLCRDSITESGLRGFDLAISVSGVTGANAHYMGADRCLECHTDHVGTKSLAHSLGFKVPNEVSPLQDLSDFPEFDMSFDYFTTGTNYTVGSKVYYYEPDSARGMDDFKISETSQGAANVIVLWLWTDAGTGIPNITFENVLNPADPMNLHTHEVRLTYGGAVNKQRYMLEWENWAADGSAAAGGNGLKGLYPTLQFQGFTVDQAGGDVTGYEGSADRSRQVWRDYHMDYYWNYQTNRFMVPGSVDGKAHNISVKCMGCHATGWSVAGPDPITGEVLSSSIASLNGEYDLDHDGVTDILNTGCESCHGAGSNHIAAQGPSGSQNGAFIVSPEDLTPSREVMLCMRCHDRISGQGEHFGAGAGDHPINLANEWPEAGMGMAEFFADYAADGVKAPKSSKNWGDDIHAKSHHQQAPDFLKSAHYRNEFELVTCVSCHDMHGGTGEKRALTADPDVVDSALCMSCHNTDLSGGDTSGHTLAMVGYDHGVAHNANASCVDCHMARMAKTGAGVESKLTLDGYYYENDITSHVFDVPNKTTLLGVLPSSAMPIPYTNACAMCHNVEDFY